MEASTPHLSYMRNLQTKQPAQTAFDRFGAGYQDYLQAPLQPLTVNLESITYEVFEKDPIKYEWYERAIARALHDWIEQGKPTSNPDGRVVVAVVGAGRGPLVTRALKASEDVDVEIDMWALEKNPNAFVLLQRHNETTWANRVNLVKSDMRSWCGPVRSTNATGRVYNTEEDEASGEESNASILTPSTPTPYKIDILISELLGSFGDNELSPECLDGVHHLLNPVHGISIPASYTAHLTPIAAPKLHADILHGMSASHPNAAETPYVVMLNAVDYLSTTIIAHADDDGHGSGQNQNALSPSPQAQSPIPSSKTTPAPYSKAHTRRSPPQSPPISTPPAPTPASSHPIVGTTWSFQHPNPSIPAVPSPNSINNTTTISEPLSNAHNARSSTLVFPIPHRGTCHGLAGYFEAVLYKGVELSTNPNTMDTKSEGMISWFPIYFPLKVRRHSLPLFWGFDINLSPPSACCVRTLEFLFLSSPSPTLAGIQSLIVNCLGPSLPARRLRTRRDHVAQDRRPESLVRMDRGRLHVSPGPTSTRTPFPVRNGHRSIPTSPSYRRGRDDKRKSKHQSRREGQRTRTVSTHGSDRTRSRI